MDPVYGFSALNVEAQLRNPGSFLHWLRRMLTERRALPVMGVGDDGGAALRQPLGAGLRALGRGGRHPDQRDRDGRHRCGPSVDGALDWGRSTVLARTVPAGNESEGDEVVHRHQAVLCVHNLSRFAQPAELALAKWAGSTPYEVLGRVPFPVITEEPYTITLPPYGFLWFDLVPEERPVRNDAPSATQALRTLTEAWLGLRRVGAGRESSIVRAEVLRAGRPGLLDIVARVGGRRAHIVVGPARRGRRAPLPAPERGGRARAARRRATGWPSAPTRYATRSWPRCCWPPCAASRPARGRWRSCATTRMPR